ncbi:MAG: hypothetical protein LC122_13995 [Chitinophagales bacterium]|nr:hypothetical protein [Chitinophagales bacterium]
MINEYLSLNFTYEGSLLKGNKKVHIYSKQTKKYSIIIEHESELHARVIFKSNKLLFNNGKCLNVPILEFRSMTLEDLKSIEKKFVDMIPILESWAVPERE